MFTPKYPPELIRSLSTSIFNPLLEVVQGCPAVNEKSFYALCQSFLPQDPSDVLKALRQIFDSPSGQSLRQDLSRVEVMWTHLSKLQQASSKALITSDVATHLRQFRDARRKVALPPFPDFFFCQSSNA
jgi:hypothetical protein